MGNYDFYGSISLDVLNRYLSHTVNYAVSVDDENSCWIAKRIMFNLGACPNCSGVLGCMAVNVEVGELAVGSNEGMGVLYRITL